jgi:hypothetical protein
VRSRLRKEDIPQSIHYTIHTLGLGGTTYKIKIKIKININIKSYFRERKKG